MPHYIIFYIFLQNGYPNAFINQQQPQHHPGHDGVQGTGGSTHSSSPQSQNTVNQSHQQFSGNMKSVNTAPVSSYDDLLDLKYRDAKQGEMNFYYLRHYNFLVCDYALRMNRLCRHHFKLSYP